MDIGTSAAKAIAVDAQGRVVARARVPHTVHTVDPDTFEHDARFAWRDGPLRALAALGEVAGGAAGLGLAACVPSLVALDDDLLPISRGLLYGDRRGLRPSPNSSNRQGPRSTSEKEKRSCAGSPGSGRRRGPIGPPRRWPRPR